MKIYLVALLSAALLTAHSSSVTWRPAQDVPLQWPLTEPLRNESYFVVFDLSARGNFTVSYDTGESWEFNDPVPGEPYWLQLPEDHGPVGSTQVQVMGPDGSNQSYLLEWDLSSSETRVPSSLSLVINEGSYWTGSASFNFTVLPNGSYVVTNSVMSETGNVGEFNHSFSLSGPLPVGFVEQLFEPGTDFLKFQTLSYNPGWVTMDGYYEVEHYSLLWDNRSLELTETVYQGDSTTTYVTFNHDLLTKVRQKLVAFTSSLLNGDGSSSTPETSSEKVVTSPPPEPDSGTQVVYSTYSPLSFPMVMILPALLLRRLYRSRLTPVRRAP